MLSSVLEQTWSLLWLWAHDVRSYQANDAIVISRWHRTIWCSILMQPLYVMSAINCSIASGIAEVWDWLKCFVGLRHQDGGCGCYSFRSEILLSNWLKVFPTYDSDRTLSCTFGPDSASSIRVLFTSNPPLYGQSWSHLLECCSPLTPKRIYSSHTSGLNHWSPVIHITVTSPSQPYLLTTPSHVWAQWFTEGHIGRGEIIVRIYNISWMLPNWRLPVGLIVYIYP